ncbi:DoxX family protein [Dyadobacter arcticus]|uniref:Oxidoreductase n=1 Tax=Dyadobacter arcticus TaxID=1078754 RepID=A0ABX0URU1_9BACT|nr:DoxX family protein [Dyadobacter arcticus]NIJ55696.1 putative oxidoreductase [Dyadobacter arcticus]
MLRKFLKPMKLPAAADLGILILRVGLPIMMIPYGYDKLNVFLSGDHSFPNPLGLGSELSYILTIFAELVCSILIVFGLFTRAALIPLIINMLVIVLIVHAEDGFDKKEHGISFLVTYLTLFLTGPGKFSLDSRLFK